MQAAPRKNLKWLTPEEREAELQADYIEPPFFAGSFNDWRYQPMMRVQDLCFLLDSAYVDPLAYLRENELVSEEVKKTDDLNQEEMQAYEN